LPVLPSLLMDFPEPCKGAWDFRIMDGQVLAKPAAKLLGGRLFYIPESILCGNEAVQTAKEVLSCSVPAQRF
jgi:hypothetical protein